MSIRPAVVVALLACTAPVLADEEIHEGILSGSGEPTESTFLVPAFDTQGGTRQLESVRFDALTAVIGGYETTGSGQEVTIHAELVADYFGPDAAPLVQTRALVHMVVVDGTPGSVTVFDSDTDTATVDSADALAAWTGTDDLELGAYAGLIVWDDPAGVINFGAGGSPRWTVTYTYSVVACTGDATGDGAVDVTDLLAVLEAWGACEGCAADFDGDGAVGVADLLVVLGAWGCGAG